MTITRAGAATATLAVTVVASATVVGQEDDTVLVFAGPYVWPPTYEIAAQPPEYAGPRRY
jgi:hypothetical protein